MLEVTQGGRNVGRNHNLWLGVQNPREVIGYELDPTLQHPKDPLLRLHLKDFTMEDFEYMDSDVGIISNPPYITKEEYANLSNDVKSYEPKIALTDNGDGLLFYNRFAEILDDMLTSNGLFLCEISSTVNSVRLSSLFTKHGIKTKILQDMNNKNRLLVGAAE